MKKHSPQNSLKWIYIKNNNSSSNSSNSNNNSSNNNSNNNRNKSSCPQITVNEEVKSCVFGNKDFVRDSCSLVSIFGAARQGKSFLMNCLSGTTELFTISNLSTPCTQGIDISRNLISLRCFSEIDGGRTCQSQNRDRIRVGFVDAEGQGDRDVTYDSHLVCPILLTSKCVLLNWMDSVQKDKILNHLGIMHKAAINVATEGNLGEEGEPIFGHLHIVFRDWRFQGDERSVLTDIFKEERSADTAAAVRNQIRRSVKESFQSIRVWLLPPPCDDTSELRSELRVDRTSEVFRDKIRELRGVLSEQLAEPMKFNGKVLTGRNMASLVETVVSVLNSGETVSPMPAWISMCMSEVESIRLRLESELRNELIEEDKKLQEYSSSEYCKDRRSVYVTLKEASNRIDNLLNNFQTEYDNEVRETVGELEGELSNQVLSTSNTLLCQTISDSREVYMSSYRKYFHEWVRILVKVTLNEMNELLSQNIPPRLPVSSNEEVELLLKEQCDEIQKDSTILRISSDYGADESTLLDIQRQMDTATLLQFESYKKLNSDLISEIKSKLDECYERSARSMLLEVNGTLEDLENRESTNPLKLYDCTNKFNKLFFDEKSRIEKYVGVLLEKRGGLDTEHEVSELVNKFHEYCLGLSEDVKRSHGVVRERIIRELSNRCVDEITNESQSIFDELEKRLDNYDHHHHNNNSNNNNNNNIIMNILNEDEVKEEFDSITRECKSKERILLLDGWGCSEEEYERLFEREVNNRSISIHKNLLSMYGKLLKIHEKNKQQQSQQQQSSSINSLPTNNNNNNKQINSKRRRTYDEENDIEEKNDETNFDNHFNKNAGKKSRKKATLFNQPKDEPHFIPSEDYSNDFDEPMSIVQETNLDITITNSSIPQNTTTNPSAPKKTISNSSTPKNTKKPTEDEDVVLARKKAREWMKARQSLAASELSKSTPKSPTTTTTSTTSTSSSSKNIIKSDPEIQTPSLNPIEAAKLAAQERIKSRIQSKVNNIELSQEEEGVNEKKSRRSSTGSTLGGKKKITQVDVNLIL